jgi:Ca-activated chloride channel homolog
MPIRPFLLWLIIAPLSAAVTVDATWAPRIKLPASETPVELARYALAVTVRGLYAECTATMVFRNPNPRLLEGELEFPLPDHATVSGYALDVNGQLVEGVVVGKDQARVVLEAERRQRIDPGLVEQVRGNLFRTRIYPVPAQGQRTVVVTWVQELALKGAEAALRIALPRCLLPELALHVDLAVGASEPMLSGFGNLTLTQWKDQRTADATLRDVTPNDDLLVRLQHLPDQLVQLEERAGERFVAISDLPAAVDTGTRLPPPKRIAVAWDASASRSAEAISRSREFLRSWFARCPGCGVDLVVFRDVPEPPQAFADAASLLGVLDHLAYDGGTGLARLDLRRSALPHPDDSCWVLLSDGIGTVGDGLPGNGDVPVYCPLADRECDASFLRLLAARSGGAALDLIDGDAASAVDAILQPPLALLRVEAPAGVLGDLQTSLRGGRATVLARLLGDGAVQLVYGTGHQERARTSVRIAAGTPPSGGVLARAWAGARAGDLGVFAEANRNELVALGQRYHLVTPGTSLIVLENLAQYLRHRIEPPDSLPGMREQYHQSLKERAVAWQGDDDNHLALVVAWWHDRLAWWKPGAQIELAQRRQPGVDPAPGTDHAAVQAIVRAAVAGIPPTQAAGIPPPATVAAGRAEAKSDQPSAVAAPAPAAPEEEKSSSDAEGQLGREEAVAGSAGPALRSAGGRRRAGAGLSGGMHSESGKDGRMTAISITPFDPATPYLRALKEAPADQAYATYLGLMASWRTSPSFYLDCAGFFLARDAALGRRVLSNLAEMRIDDPSLLRIFSWRLQEAGDLDLAVAVLRRVLSLRPEEPQSYRDLALALSARGEARARGADLAEAMGLLYRVVLRQPLEEVNLGERADLMQGWNRFPQIEIIALEELNRLLTVSESRSWDHPPVVPPLDPRLRMNLDCDLRVVMSWDADATDIDLHVVEPSGEEAYYARQRTRSGGLVSSDMTQGYGPEEYLIHQAPAGTYAIRCHYYGTRAQTLLGPATVSAVAITDWGRAGERRQQLTLRLDKSGEFQSIGAITLGAGRLPPGVQSANGAITRDQLQQLAVGQHRAEVEARLGAPLRIDGEGVTVLVYTMANGAMTRLGFGPDLLWAREVSAGAELDLLPH